ncbi:MAG: hypothetical protein ABR936_15555 [Bacteroidota bacterium]|jgi:hypothetical protein
MRAVQSLIQPVLLISALPGDFDHCTDGGATGREFHSNEKIVVQTTSLSNILIKEVKL